MLLYERGHKSVEYATCYLSEEDTNQFLYEKEHKLVEFATCYCMLADTIQLNRLLVVCKTT